MSERWSNYKLDALRTPSSKLTRAKVAETVFPASRDLHARPAELDLRGELLPVRDQGSQGSCVAECCACMKEWQERKDIELHTYMSPQFVYDLRSTYPKEGMYIDNAMHILKNYGDCYEQTYPYGKPLKREEIPQEAYAIAKNYKISDYARVTTIDGLKTALYKNGPCIVMVPVYNYKGRMWKPKQGDKSIGNHALTICGYTKDGFIIRNSWGDDWNRGASSFGGGYTIFPYEDWGLQVEIWTCIDAASEKPDNPPEPDDNKKKNNCLPINDILRILKIKNT